MNRKTTRPASRSVIVLAVVGCTALVVHSGCGSKRPATGAGQVTESEPAPRVPDWLAAVSRAPARPKRPPVVVKVRPVERPSDRRPGDLQPVDIRPLGATETAAVLARMPALPKRPLADTAPVAMPDSRPPPRADEIRGAPFPPLTPKASGHSGALADTAPASPQASPQAPDGPLEVVRYGPAGEVEQAAEIAISFSRPMVAVGSHLAAGETRPARISPVIPGRWRWLGTETLVFTPDEPLAAGASLDVEVPAGAKALTGHELAEPVRFSVRIAPPRIVEHEPDREESLGAQPIFWLLFNRPIEPATLVQKTQFSAGGRRVPARFATEDEVAGDPEMALNVRYMAPRLPGHYMLVKPVEPLAPDDEARLTIAAGTEGARQLKFVTYSPLKATLAACQPSCEPDDDWEFRFNNQIDEQAVEALAGQISIEPALADRRVQVKPRAVHIVGTKRAGTNYRVILPAAIRDVHEQTLGVDAAFDVSVGHEPPVFEAANGLLVLDPQAPAPIYSVSTNRVAELRVEVRAVAPMDWPLFAAHVDFEEEHEDGHEEPAGRPPLPGRSVVDTRIPVKGDSKQLTVTDIDLGPALTGGLGHAVVVVEPMNWPTDKESTDKESADASDKPRAVAWVQVTQLGLDALVDDDELWAWTTSLRDGAPVAGADLEIWPHRAKGRTGKDGLGRVQLPRRAPDGRTFLLARLGGDTAILPAQNSWDTEPTWLRRDQDGSVRFFVFDDRGMYRPGETLAVKGWVRQIGVSGGDVTRLPAGATLRYRVMDGRSTEIAVGERALSPTGGFDISLTLPADARPGKARIELSLADETYSHRYSIAEFRRPEFKVDVRAQSGVAIGADPVVWTAAARYYAGGGLSDADIHWMFTTAEAQFTPPNHQDFSFGTWRPWWRWHARGWYSTDSLYGTTDDRGDHSAAVSVASATPMPISVKAEATVYDVNRQRWSVKGAALVHPASVYVGLRQAEYFHERGRPLSVDVAVVDLDSRAVSGRPVSVVAVAREWVPDGDDLKQVEHPPVECAFTSTDKVRACSFAADVAGTYTLTAKVRDQRGRANQSQTMVWVTGGAGPAKRYMGADEVELIPDKLSYAPGETARILVQTPFAPARGLLTVRRLGIERVESFTMNQTSTVLTVAIVDAHTPNLSIAVELVGTSPRENADGVLDPSIPGRPAYGTGKLDISVPPVHRRLAVAVHPRVRETRPGAKTAIDVAVSDWRGAPVAGAEVAVVVVDEAVLAMTGKPTPDPLPRFYPSREDEVETVRSRELLQLVRPELFKPPSPEGSGGRARSIRLPTVRIGNAVALGRFPHIDVREDFRPLALFAPAVATDRRGRASVALTLPDSLTRYRVMAVAAHADRYFGSGESSITARLPLTVRPSPPRFLNVGDRFELPVVVHNQSQRVATVDVAIRTDLLALTAGAGRRVAVPANGRVEVRFPAVADVDGVARVQVGGSETGANTGANAMADAASIEIPVRRPVASESFATYGTLEAGVVKLPVAVPAGVDMRHGGLEITTAGTQVHGLSDALAYLTSYPYRCSEQLASRILAVVAVRDVLAALAVADVPSPAQMDAALARDLAALDARQRRRDGSFGVWHRRGPSVPFFNVHVAHALARAKERGVALPGDVLERALEYLRNIDAAIPDDYPRAARKLVGAYALYVRQRLGSGDTNKARNMLAMGAEKLPLEAVGWLLATLARDPGARADAAALVRFLGNRVTETAGSASFAAGFGRGAHLVVHSSQRADGVLLEALIDADPKHPLIPKLARGLLAQRVGGAWRGTQENAFILLALQRYVEVFEKTAPEGAVRTWLGQQFAGEHRLAARAADHRRIGRRIVIPMSQLSAGRRDLTLEKTGPGRAYYRVAMRYAPATREVPPVRQGFSVYRLYEAVDDPADVVRGANGAWTVRAGARVRVRVTMTASAKRHHVALVDRLPAGLEAQNPEFAGTADVPDDDDADDGAGRSIWWWRVWYEYQAMGDQRAEAFASRLPAGTYEYTYLAVATTPGEFIAPPARAEEMYASETFGRSASDVIVVAAPHR